MKLSQLLEGSHSLAIQRGNFDKDTAFGIRSDLSKIIKKHINEKEWEHNKHFLDQGIVYNGEDIHQAMSVIDKIIGDIYGYFVDVNQKERTPVRKSYRLIGKEQQEVYVVKPQGTIDKLGKRTKAEPQIEFFKFKDKPELGITINVRKD